MQNSLHQGVNSR